MKFKIGDRVKMNEKSTIEGKVGYIVAIDDEDVHVPYLVEVPGWHGDMMVMVFVKTVTLAGGCLKMGWTYWRVSLNR